MPEIIDPVFAKTSQNARFLLSENERFGLVFVITGSINSGTDAGPSGIPTLKKTAKVKRNAHVHVINAGDGKDAPCTSTLLVL